jgi:sortase A
MARAHRSLRIVVVLLTSFALLALGFLHTNGSTSSAAPVLHVTDVPVINTTTTVAPTTTVVAKPAAKGGPVRPPANAYAVEPIQLIGQLEIPKIGLVTPIYNGITLRNIDLGPSHWPGTAMPGDVGNAVFAGHRVTHTHPFLHIDDLVPGDQVIFTVDGRRSVYSVTGHEVVKPDALWIADQTPTATATIFGCHPPHSASFRYVVHMSLVQQ